MAEEYSERSYSVFWPVVIFQVAFMLSCFYQIGQVMVERDALQKRLTAEAVNLPKAQDAQNRLVALINDLASTAAHDQNAALIVEEARQAGIIRDNASATAAPNSAPASGP